MTDCEEVGHRGGCVAGSLGWLRGEKAEGFGEFVKFELSRAVQVELLEDELRVAQLPATTKWWRRRR